MLNEELLPVSLQVYLASVNMKSLLSNNCNDTEQIVKFAEEQAEKFAAFHRAFSIRLKEQLSGEKHLEE